MLRIIQLTDIHIPDIDSLPYNIDVRSQFFKCLIEIEELQPHLLVLSGDICLKEGNSETYFWVKEQLDKLKIPIEVIPGNHDNPQLLADVFLKNEYLQYGNEYYFSHYPEGKQIIFLDSSKGYCSKRQYSWLKNELANAEDECIIFMHHPPVKAGVPHMDFNYAFQQPEIMHNIVLESGREVHIFCGHYHVERSISYKNLHIHITPSTFFTLNGDHTGFEIEHSMPAFRIIDWNGMGSIMYRTKYLAN